MSTIPGSQIVNVAPSVLAAGGSAIDLNGLVLTADTRVPIGTVPSFPSLTAVQQYFGSSSQMAAIAGVYFGGYDGSSAKPGALLATQYPTASVSAYVRGGNISAVSLATLQSYSGTLSVTIDGVLKSSAVNLSAATSYSNAAEIIAGDLAIEGVQAAVVTASIATSVMTVTAVSSGTLGAGDVISGGSITTGTYIGAQLTSTETDGHLGGKGTYSVVGTATQSSTTVTAFTPGVQYDSVSGAFVVLSGTAGASSTITYGSGAMATDLLLTQATGAVLSQGTVAATPSTFMNSVIAITQNWATFMTAFNPDNSGNANKLLFAAWANAQNDRYAYVCWDTDITPTQSVPATTSLGYLIAQASYSGTILIYEPSDLYNAPFVMGWAASLNFTQTNGRATLAFRSQSGLTPGVTDGVTALNLGGNPQTPGDRGNGYNFYGTYGSGNADQVFLNRGFVSGPFLWADSYVIQIWLNNLFQVTLIDLLMASGTIPYNAKGQATIEEGLSGAIQAGLNFGAYVPGVELSSSQIAEVNAAAGVDVATTLQNRGWYLQIKPATASVRAARSSPPMTFWYTDGESVQAINLNSVAVQ